MRRPITFDSADGPITIDPSAVTAVRRYTTLMSERTQALVFVHGSATGFPVYKTVAEVAALVWPESVPVVDDRVRAVLLALADWTEGSDGRLDSSDLITQVDSGLGLRSASYDDTARALRTLAGAP